MDKQRQEALARLGHETAPAKRRALIEEITAVFREPSGVGPRELHQIGEALLKIVPSLPVPERVRISERLATSKAAPADLVHRLAMDAPEVATPILSESPALSEADLVACAREGGSLRLSAIARRPSLSASLQSRIVESGDSHAIGALVGNTKLALSPDVQRAILTRARRDETVAERLLERTDVPPSTLCSLFFALSPLGRMRLLRILAHRPLPASPSDAEPDVEALIVDAIRSGHSNEVTAALTRGLHLGPAFAEQVLQDESCMAMAAVIAATRLSRAVYSTFAVLGAQEDPSEALAAFERIPAAGARHLLVHWQSKTERAPKPAALPRPRQN